MAGRPSTLTPAVADRVVALVRDGNYLEVAAAGAGVPKSTFFAWLAKGRRGVEPYRELVDRVKAAEGDAERTAVELVRAAGLTTWQAAAWWLERKAPGRWGGQRQEVAALRKHLRQLETLLAARAPDPPPAAPQGSPAARGG